MEKEVDSETIVNKNEESSKMSSCFLCESFPGSLEWIYLKFSQKQKKVGLECLLVTALLFDIYMIFVPARPMVLPAICFFIVHVGLLIFCKMQISSREIYCVILAIVCALLPFVQILMAILMKEGDISPREYLGWALLFDYLICLTLPLPLWYCVALSWGSCLAYLMTILMYQRPFRTDLVFRQILANLLLLATTTILGITAYIVEDKQQRKTFLETRQSLEVKLVIEEQSAEQERLLLSVLPEHVAVQMRQDLDQADSQFKKIYMSRHENVSILYADIVGFTAISSTYSAQELVKMLNELFARFDKLAEKYEQLRIKILGDCYYCISGAPVERPDHAVLCVHMGLSMVDAIKYVQQTANSPVDMRVGIHTGAVLAGVLGQRQWQFDVYSKDVELANKMESSGKAGRVHISATTLSFLNGEFEVEPAFGEKRDEALRIAGLKTYFIVKVLKPFKPPKNVQNGDTTIDADADNVVISEMKTFIEEKNSSEPTRARSNSEQFAARLMAELVSRDGYRQLAKKSNCFTLCFTDERKEFGYARLSETSFIFLVLILLILRTVFVVSSLITQPSVITKSPVMFRTEIVLAIFVLFTAMLDCYSLTIGCSRYLPSYMIIFKMVGAGISIFMLTVSNYLDSRTCGIIGNDLCSLLNMDQTCLFPSYFSYFTVIILIGTSLPICMRYWCKIGLLALTTSIQCFVNEHYLNDLLECSFLRSEPWTNLSQEKYNLCGVLICAAISMGFLSRHMEQVIRVLFLWRSEVEEQRHCAEDLKRRNEALVYNILPPHVAAHFMGNRNRNYDELYSQSYEEVGVLFASMPNFSDFYSEETVNNQGLECLRFLNEVISDFDALLELPQYHDIIKIKTIGSTYMAASGLNPSRQIRPDDPIQVRWAHLSLLVEFALDLKKALQSINEQSFNHFVLKMGINHGPITAGVIGARKPHYDIWGNTVNVASRMESTGKAGCIQVTEETCEILQAFDYRFEHRGLVAVKGKGQLMTYYLQGKSGKITPPTVPASPDILETIQKAKEETPERTEVNYPEEVDDDVFILEIEASELQGKADMTNSNRFHGEPPLLRPLKLL